MISKKDKNFIENLKKKKYREQYNMFIVEGKKAIGEFLKSSFSVESIYATQNIWSDVDPKKIKIVSKEELNTISSLKNPDEGVGIFHMKNNNDIIPSRITIALDNVRDPGNLGTIIRLCDWYDIKQIVCSQGCVECYNPKVVQSTMGSLSRVNITYTNLGEYLKSNPCQKLACTLNGKNIYEEKIEGNAIVVMGNEANGISEDIVELCDQKITIPQMGEQTAQSLNVSIATAIVVSKIIGG